jgi:valyl-tRNA synthetase
MRAAYNIPNNKRLAWLIQPSADWVRGEWEVLKILLHAESLAENSGGAPANAAVCVTGLGEIYLPLEGVVDAAAERTRLQGEIGKVEAEIEKVARKLSSESFVNNAPAEVVAEHRQRQADWQERLATLQRALESLG